jgi:hypothetical protein
MLQKMHLSQIGPGWMPRHIIEVLDASTAMGIAHNAKAREEHDVLSAFFGEIMFLGGRDCRDKRKFLRDHGGFGWHIQSSSAGSRASSSTWTNSPTACR